MTGLCLAVAAVIRATLPAGEFTLAWTHSVEKIRWEEDYRVEDGALVPVVARIRGSGAGMEPPPHAVLRDGVWHYRPDGPAHPRLRVTVSPYTDDYDLCWNRQCAKLADLVGMANASGVVEIFPCAAAGADVPTARTRPRW
jgi:hypothetical protein